MILLQLHCSHQNYLQIPVDDVLRVAVVDREREGPDHALGFGFAIFFLRIMKNAHKMTIIIRWGQLRRPGAVDRGGKRAELAHNPPFPRSA